MDIFSIDLTHNEIHFIRQALELPMISGKDAKFLAGLQLKIENELSQIDQMLKAKEKEKQAGLQKIVEEDRKKVAQSNQKS